MYRCLDCDYSGHEANFNEETEEFECPLCGYDCSEIEEMTEEQDAILDTFFENNRFLVAADKNVNRDAEPIVFLWEDFKLMKESFTEEEYKELHFCTLLDCEDEEAWISPGYHYVNRLGYFISREPIVMPEEGVRYW